MEYIKNENGNKFYYVNGELHRDNGPSVICLNGYKAFFYKGKRHREDGPAIQDSNGHKYWYYNGVPHREDGPAVEWRNGGYKAWYINGERYTEKEYKVKMERIRKIRFKFFKLWELNCDQPGKKLFEIRINRAMDNIEELF